MLLEEIKNKLLEIDGHVVYGLLTKKDLEDLNGVWDYIVFDRAKMSASGNKNGYSDTYSVAIVRENFIPEGFELEVIDKILEIPGMRLGSGEFAYDYVTKKNTNTVVEMLVLEFVKAKKKVTTDGTGRSGY